MSEGTRASVALRMKTRPIPVPRGMDGRQSDVVFVEKRCPGLGAGCLQAFVSDHAGPRPAYFTFFSGISNMLGAVLLGWFNFAPLPV